MKDGSDNSDRCREMYEDLSGFEDEDEALVAAPPVQKNRLLHFQQQDQLGSDHDPNTASSASPDDNGPLVKAMGSMGSPARDPYAWARAFPIYFRARAGSARAQA